MVWFWLVLIMCKLCSDMVYEEKIDFFCGLLQLPIETCQILYKIIMIITDVSPRTKKIFMYTHYWVEILASGPTLFKKKLLCSVSLNLQHFASCQTTCWYTAKQLTLALTFYMLYKPFWAIYFEKSGVHWGLQWLRGQCYCNSSLHDSLRYIIGSISIKVVAKRNPWLLSSAKMETRADENLMKV